MQPRLETSNKRHVAWIAVVSVALLGFGWVFVAWFRPPLVVGHNQPIQYDDFGFEVAGVHTIMLEGKRYTLVRLEVHNWAKRVDFQFKRSSVAVKDAAGRRFDVSPEGQRAFDAARRGPDPCAHALAAGTSCATELVFDLPQEISDPRLVIQSGWLGDFLDTLLVGRKEIRLAGGDRSK